MADSTAYTTLGTVVVLVVGLVTLAGLRLRDFGNRVDDLSATVKASIKEQGAGLGARIDDTNSRIEQQGASLGARIDDTNRRISSLESTVETGLSEVGARFTQMEARFDGMETRFDGMDSRFDRLTREVHGLRVDVVHVGDRVTAHVEGHLHGNAA